MSNGDDKTTKAIDLYNIQFEDPTITEPEDLQDIIESLQPTGIPAPNFDPYDPKSDIATQALYN